MEQIGDRIKKRREQLNLKQSDLAEMIHFGRSALSLIEINKNRPGYDALTGLAAALNCSLDWLCRGHEWGGDLYRVKSPLRLELDSYLDKLQDSDLPPLIDLAAGTAFRRAKSATSER